MATTHQFRFPPVSPKFICYTPPKLQPAQRRPRKRVELTTDEWHDIDEALEETVSECDLTSDDVQQLLSTADPTKSQESLHSSTFSTA